jgi:hypothetical protein
MDIDRLLKSASFFYSLATESLPKNSKDLKTILSNLEKLDTFKARKKYASNNLKKLSSGSSRAVYLTNNDTVIKLAKNTRGYAQNKAEATAKIKSNRLNKIINKAKDYLWIESPFLKKITENKFKKMTNLDFKEFGDSLRYGLRNISGNLDKDKPKSFEDVSKTSFYKEIKEICNSLNLLPGDLAKLSSWCELDNEPIIIDFGLTKEIFSDYYESSTSS